MRHYTAKMQRGGRLTIPAAIRRLLNIKPGDLLELKAKPGKIVITPRIVIDRSKFPTADDEYTPKQRAIVDAQLAEGLADIKAGRVSRAFDTHAEFIADLHKSIKKPSAKK
jgi:AbrB family looped-hinge helix DNA binding protein